MLKSKKDNTIEILLKLIQLKEKYLIKRAFNNLQLECYNI
jgi:hypothetical protein